MRYLLVILVVVLCVGCRLEPTMAELRVKNDTVIDIVVTLDGAVLATLLPGAFVAAAMPTGFYTLSASDTAGGILWEPFVVFLPNGGLIWIVQNDTRLLPRTGDLTAREAQPESWIVE